LHLAHQPRAFARLFTELEEIMPLVHRTAVAVLTTLSLSAVAQQGNSPANPADPQAVVPTANYQSAFQRYRPATDEDNTPDQVWRMANDEMKRLGGHAGHTKDSEGGRSDGPSANGHDMPQHGKGR
jgi:hypothetical protein